MNAPRIFVSHSHVDDGFGQQLVADLRARLGAEAVWYDASGGLHGGDEWWRTISAEITARDTFLVILSPDALASDWVPREMAIAYWQHVKIGKRLLPLFYRACDPPPEWQLLHGFDFSDPAHYPQGLATLLTELGATPQQAPPVVAPAPQRTPQALLAERLATEIHTAFGRQEWPIVVQKSDLLLAEVAAAMTTQLWRERGLAFLTVGQPAQALQALAPALQADPYDLPTLRAQAQGLAATGKTEEALQALARAQALAPLDGDLPTKLGIAADQYALQWAAHRYDAALGVCDEALRLAPQDVTWKERRAQVQAAQAEEKLVPPVLRTKGFMVVQGKAIVPPLSAVIPAGQFVMGGDAQSYQGSPKVSVNLGAFQIGLYPVTVAEYACAVAAGAVPAPATSGNVTWAGQQQHLDHPVVCVSWLNARDYAAWLAGVTGQPWRLPSEPEWERAARGTDGRIFPWGNTWDAARANTSEGGPGTTTPVGAYADKGDASPVGAHDLAGNVWEWTKSLWADTYDAIKCESDSDSSTARVLRGGSWDDSSQLARAASRLRSTPDFFHLNWGFRLALAAGGW
jgi:formylglycine-generating enzyme required for sulfatase activity